MRNSSRRANETFEKSVVSYTFAESQLKKSTIYGGKIIYIICNLKKFHKNDVADIEKENERDETYVGDNKNIDHEKTILNYHVVKPEASYWDKINKELATLQTNRKIRKDAVYICSCVLGASSEFFEGKTFSEQRQFFTDYAKLFADKYGKQNIVSAVVHMDETTPHMHLNFIPITEGRLCAKELCNRKLSQLQTEVWKKVGEKYGLNRGKPNSQAVHLDTAEYKAKKIVEAAKQRSAEIDEQTERKQAELTELTQAVEKATDKPIPKKKKGVEKEITALRTKTAMQEQEIKIRGRDQSDLFKQLQEAKKTDSRKETAYKVVVDMMSAYPDEFDELLKKSRDKKASISHTPVRKNKSDWSK